MFNELALFAGAGGGILGGHLLGWRTVCAVEFDHYAASVLMARQNDGCLPPFPIWNDVRTFDGRPWRGRVDVVSGGFPCQDISAAGQGAGIEGARSGLWGEMARIIGEVRPRFVLVENSPMLTSRGLGRVLGDLAALGYDARWGVLGACDAGAPHQRDRIWIVADAEQDGRLGGRSTHEPGALAGAPCGKGGSRDSIAGPVACGGPYVQDDTGRSGIMADADKVRWPRWSGASGLGTGWDEPADGGATLPDADRQRQQEQPAKSGTAQHATTERGGWWQHEPSVGRVADGVAARVDRLACLGNGQVPAVVRLAWRRVGLMR